MSVIPDLKRESIPATAFERELQSSPHGHTDRRASKFGLTFRRERERPATPNSGLINETCPFEFIAFVFASAGHLAEQGSEVKIGIDQRAADYDDYLRVAQGFKCQCPEMLPVLVFKDFGVYRRCDLSYVG
jgi:hypothetical protein